ncbi:ABC transporter ATP-binding protein [Actinoallomurus iriomotensis]|uniref:Multidrug ABC transporter ATP-binding protein n=1 Tax=Actinoallomurus iriomotensis TaxID=478107 RepID=A0A9W6RU09_9ACTN|nr:ABC transporter ATP-binding protein [Actinoallomurus iriomotensis]GLY81658.1 multidrug ABC transporter ATP-binding protein [Actinoallomurus iriomotensis]
MLAQAQEVSVRFGSFTAVRAVNMTVGPGEVVGLLGANGAGKTTLIRVLLGLLRPSAGRARLFGARPSLETRRSVGYVPQTLGLYSDLTVRENWSFAASAFGRAGTRVPADLRPWEDDLVGGLSLGVARRVAFAVALSHEPKLFVLDEPTSGVGPLGAARLWQEIRQAAEQGAGVLVTTHNMEEAEQCDRLYVMVAGRVEAEGAVAEVIGDRTVLEVRCADWMRAYQALDDHGFAVQAHGSVLRVPVPPGERDTVTGLLEHAGMDVTVRVRPAGLEEAFMAILGDGRAAHDPHGAQAGGSAHA